jgi:hypothetical protein
MKAELEAGCRSLSGHLIELGLIVASDPRVSWIVGVGGGEGGGARAEGAIHEGFELADVEERIVGVVAGAVFFEGLERESEVQPLGDTEF